MSWKGSSRFELAPCLKKGQKFEFCLDFQPFYSQEIIQKGGQEKSGFLTPSLPIFRHFYGFIHITMETVQNPRPSFPSLSERRSLSFRFRSSFKFYENSFLDFCHSILIWVLLVPHIPISFLSKFVIKYFLKFQKLPEEPQSRRSISSYASFKNLFSTQSGSGVKFLDIMTYEITAVPFWKRQMKTLSRKRIRFSNFVLARN